MSYLGLSKPIKVGNRANIDAKYGPYISVQEGLKYLPQAERSLGLTFGVISGGKVQEYWFKSGLTDMQCVPKGVDGIEATATTTTISGNTIQIGNTNGTMQPTKKIYMGFVRNADVLSVKGDANGTTWMEIGETATGEVKRKYITVGRGARNVGIGDAAQVVYVGYGATQVDIGSGTGSRMIYIGEPESGEIQLRAEFLKIPHLIDDTVLPSEGKTTHAIMVNSFGRVHKVPKATLWDWVGGKAQIKVLQDKIASLEAKIGAIQTQLSNV